MKVVLASKNRHKWEEIRKITEKFDMELVMESDLGVDIDVEETGTTFEENSFLKANAVMQATGLPALADDSGIAVDALNGEPGIYSARYGGEGLDDHGRNLKLLEELGGVTDRTGRFVCSIAYIDAKGEKHSFEGVCEGVIGYEEKGENGFGYDPLFLVGEKSFAQLSGTEKDALSHRGKANRLLCAYIAEQK